MITKMEGMKRYKFGRMFQKLGYKVGAELGVKRGEFSELLCKSIPDLKLFCIDPYLPYESGYQEFLNPNFHESNYTEAYNRLLPYNVIFVKKKSSEAVLDFEDESLDFVFIDSNHYYDYIMEDIITWGRKVRVGGIISGHDYLLKKNKSDVLNAVNDYVRSNNIENAYFTDEREPSFWWIKTKKSM